MLAPFSWVDTPEAIGDYAGPNHVLPTARTARFSSGLGVTDFMKRTTTVAVILTALLQSRHEVLRLPILRGLVHMLSNAAS